jgi:hypothetical protein
MDPLQFIDNINDPMMLAVYGKQIDISDKERVIQALKIFYCRYFAEDKIDGSPFDIKVINFLDVILTG